MKIERFIYSIISLILIFILLVLTVMFSEHYFLFFILMIIIIIPNNILKRKEQRNKIQILLSYSNTGNTDKYIEDIKDLHKKSIMSISDKTMDEISVGLALISAGEFEKAEQLMIELSKKQSKISDITMIFYLRFCADYFFYTNKVEELKLIVDKLEHVIKNANTKIQSQLSIVFLLSEAKKNILEEKNLDAVKSMYLNMNIAPTPVNILSKNYILSIIDIKQKNYKDAITKLQNLAEMKYNLFFVNNAKKLLNELQKN